MISKDRGIAIAAIPLSFLCFLYITGTLLIYDRRIILDGMYMPDEFYHPDYSHRPLEADIRDYRRTLYWNPNACLNEEGRFAATFYNNGKLTRIRVATAGIITNDVK